MIKIMKNALKQRFYEDVLVRFDINITKFALKVGDLGAEMFFSG